MATRRAIKDVFYSELNGLAGNYTADYGGGDTESVTLDADDIGVQRSGDDSSLPSIHYLDNYRRVNWNGAGAGPVAVEYDSNDDVTRSVWREYIEAQFLVHVRGGNDVIIEPIYETVRDHFGKYQFANWSVKSLHADIIRINIEDATSIPVGSSENPEAVENLEVYITFQRDYEITSDGDVENIDQINHEVDSDLDTGTSGLTYTTN